MNLCFMYNVNVQLLFLLLILLVGLPVKVRPEADGGGRTRFQNGNEGVTRDKHTPTRDCSNAQIPENVLPGLQVVFPVMSRSERDLPLSTFNKDTQAYKRHVVVRFTYNGVKHKLKLQHNSKLMAKKRAGDYIQGRDCYYQGFCSRSEHMGKESLVSLSTCDGLRYNESTTAMYSNAAAGGVIEIDGVAHRIYPHEQSTKDMECRPHIIYKMTSAKDSLCGNQSGQWSSFEKLHSDQVQNIVEQKYRGDPLVSGERRSTDPRYLELALIVDNSLFGKFGFSEDKAMEFVLQITNIIDMYYQRLNIRVGLIYHEFWTEDNIKISSNPRETLLNFVKYAETNLDSTHYDLAHLLSGQLFDGRSSGLAVPDSVCLKRGVAVISSQSEENSRHLASVISHMIGHNIGLLHDTKDCQCEDLESGCIMDMNLGSKSPTQFSSCSVSRLQMLTRVGLGSCLLDEPQENPFPQSCGNGFVERGEQCDCGTAENCEREDPCCEPTTCLLKPNARCRSGPCCHNCLPKASTQVCRSADSDCDAAEYCDGVTGECPADSTIADGQPCPGGICYNGRCPTREAQCKQFWDTEAAAAHDECYTYNNPQGNLFGHCGLDKEGQPIKCSQQDSFCGLLQCAGGTRYTIQSNLEYRTTSVGSNANTKYQCKVVIANLEDDLAAVGMVLDGSTCGDGKVCLNSKCVSTAESFALAQCPKGENNLTCSGNGRCTTVKTCSCNHGYDGILCDQILPTSYSKDVGADLTNPEAERRTLDTKWLIVIICVVTVVVISAAVIAFLCCRFKCLCCRRQVVSPARKRPNKRKQSHLNESLDLERDRAISFGQTPSYRNEKDGKRKRRRKRKPSSSGEDETDSDERAAGADRVDIVIPEELSRQPERGILKKSTSSAFEGIEDDECHSQCSCTDTGSCSCSDHDNEPAPIDRHIHTSTNQDPEQEIPPPREFDTNMYSKRFETNAQVEVNHCEEVSPTDSEHMQYCAPEVDQYYKTFTPPYNKYNPVLPPQSQQGADSATDSAIDMPGDGSVSTINDIAPLHHKHKPTIIDYLDIQSQSDDSRSPRVYRPPPPPYIKRNTPTLTGQGQISSPPTIQEYSKPPINRSLESNRHATESSFHSFTPPHSDRGSDYTTRLDETRVDDSVVV